VRENNEDSVHLYARDQFALAIVADGMGGAAAGEEASRIAVETIHTELAASDHQGVQRYQWMDEDTLAETIVDAIHSANLNIGGSAQIALKAWAPPSRWPGARCKIGWRAMENLSLTAGAESNSQLIARW
jgi:serine/threonine protein phosphatase PrpC